MLAIVVFVIMKCKLIEIMIGPNINRGGSDLIRRGVVIVGG